MSRISELGFYFVLIFLAIVLFAVSWAPITGYISAVSSEGIDMKGIVSSKGVTHFRNTGYRTAMPEEGVDVREIIRSEGITYVENEVIDKFSENNKVRVIIKFRRDIKDLNLAEEGLEKKQGNLFSGELDKTGLARLIDSLGNEIESIGVDHEFISMFDVDRAALKIRADSAWDYGLSGKGQTACVIDTGIDYNHENLSGKYIGGYDFVNDDDDPMDDHGHGTYMSGLILSVAPDARIIAAKALGEDGKGYESDIIAAIDYCIENRDLYNISVISMSLSGGSFGGYCDSVLVTNKANFASEQGIFVVAASGNGGWSNLTAPACGTKVTSVGATTMDDSLTYERETPCGTKTYETNINPLLDLLAPGISETGGSTSIATAVAAGAALLVLEKESLKPMELEYRLRSTGFVIEHEGMNYSRVDVYNAINNIVTNTPSEQVGEQSKGNWEEYATAVNCDCSVPAECSTNYYCSSQSCTFYEGNIRLCASPCIAEGNACSGPDDEACEECYGGPWSCQWE